MAAAMSCLCPLNDYRLTLHSPSPSPSPSPSRPCIQSRIRASSLSSVLRRTSFLLPISPFSKNNKVLSERNASITARAQWGAGEDEGGRNTWQGRGRDTDDTSFYVGNLPYSVDSAELFKLFENAGNVTKVEVKYNKETGRSRGFAFVNMATRDEVAEAVDKFNGREYQGRTLKVSSGPGPVKNNFNQSMAPRGEDSEVVDRFNGYEYQGRNLRVNSRPGPAKNNFASKPGFRNVRSGGGGGFDSENQMYVGNLPWGADNYTLEQLFKIHGSVKDAKVVYDRDTGRSRGFGFVTMSSSEEVEAAISSLDGADMDGRPLRVRIA